MKIHPIFHVSLLEPYRESIFPGRVQGPPPNIKIENHEEYEVETVLDSRRRREKLDNFVHWNGYDINERTWEDAKNLANASKKVQEFHQQYPHKPKPLQR
jgi:hypothetical protein